MKYDVSKTHSFSLQSITSFFEMATEFCITKSFPHFYTFEAFKCLFHLFRSTLQEDWD